MSLPAWERGLKPLKPDAKMAAVVSLPAWERGLKHDYAWEIETAYGRSLRGSVD